jgi:hypothetical protein
MHSSKAVRKKKKRYSKRRRKGKEYTESKTGG